MGATLNNSTINPWTDILAFFPHHKLLLPMYMGQQMHLQHDDRQVWEQVWNWIFCLVPLIQINHFPNTVEVTPSMAAWHCCHIRAPHKTAEGKMAIRVEGCLHPACVCSSVISQATGLTAALLPTASVFYLPAHWVLLTALRTCLHHNYTSWLRSRFCGIMFKAHLCPGTFHRTIPQTAAARGGPEGINPKLPPSTPWSHSAIASVQNTVTKHLCPMCCPRGSHWQCFRPTPLSIKAKLPTSTSSSHTRSIHNFYQHTRAHFNKRKRKPGQHIPLWIVFASDTKQR